jgi:hypothetical protein
MPDSMWPNVTIAGWVLVPVFGLACIGGGFYALVKWIPNTPSKESRTDIYSTRASCYVVGVGLSIITLWALCALAVRTVAMLKALKVV